MRPINRGGQGSYVYDVRLDSDANLEHDLKDSARAPRLKFTAPAVIKAYSTAKKKPSSITPTMWNLLDGLREVDLDTSNTSGFSSQKVKNYEAAADTVRRRLDAQYGKARGPLRGNLGDFCDYCEQYLPGNIAVEHMIPKGHFPYFYLCWGNFTLVCERCNGSGSGKGTGPTRLEVVAWGGAALHNDVDYWNRIYNRFLWPTMASAYRDTLPRLEYDANAPNNAWTPFATQTDSVHQACMIVGGDVNRHTIEANLSIGGALPARYPVRSMVTALPNTPASRALRYFGLDTESQDAVDAEKRVYNRTRTWFQAVATIWTLKDAIAGGNQNSIDRAWNSLITNAPSGGFLSVWIRVLDLLQGRTTFYPNANPAITLMDKFKQDIVTPQGFPGTNMAQVP